MPPSVWAVMLLGAAVAVLLALTVSAQTYLSMRTHGHSFIRLFMWQLSSWLFWAAAAPLVLRAGRALASGANRRRCLLTVGLGAVLVGVHAVVAALCTVWIQPLVPVVTRQFADSLVNQLGLLLVADFFAFAVVLAVGIALTAYDRARLSELRESQLEAQLTRANLEALRLEIQPHFLFNTLNAIGALIRRQSAAQALDMLIGLSDLLRRTLERRPANLSTLESEIAFVRKYVDLYHVRFSDRLEVTYDLDPAALPEQVPTFVLQPLVENAFRHGVSLQTTASKVEIGARRHGTMLDLWVADNGPGIAPGFVLDDEVGTGLGNVRSRLQWLFGPAARLDIRRRETGGTIATISLPSLPVQTGLLQRAAS
jgi:two-component system, LytTR family, sensor kinase